MRFSSQSIKRIITLASILVVFSACQKSSTTPVQPLATVTPAVTLAGEPTPDLSATPANGNPTATAAPLATDTPEASPSPSPTPQTNVWLSPSLPAGLVKSLKLPDGVTTTSQADSAPLKLEVGNQAVVSQWVLALVAPFPTVSDGVSSVDLKNAWKGQPISGDFAGLPLLMSQNTFDMLSSWWGNPAEAAVKVLPDDQLVGYAWDHLPAWGIVPFEALEPRWKVLEVDGISPLRKEFDLQQYVLSVPISLQGVAADPQMINSFSQAMPASNRDPSKLTTLVMTGVTALVRGTALTMERLGITYPDQDIRDWLRGADLTHISNEVPFYDKCPFPSLHPAEWTFCSDPRYIALLEDVGTKIVELTGDHFGDYGPEAVYQTLDLYKQEGWSYYGGGLNADDAKKPLLIENHGNKLAFLGCNGKGIKFYAPADATTPGAVECDYDYLTKEIASLKAQGYIVIMSFQHVEYYNYYPQPLLITDFHKTSEAGADIVSGSQAHQPHGMEFLGDKFIHYGLGNLFFDQFRLFSGPETDQAFIDRHVFYDNRYIGTELLTIEFVDAARSRPMTPDERRKFLELIFANSIWK